MSPSAAPLLGPVRSVLASSSAPLSQARSVILIGLPGVGKTTIGRRLARRLGHPFCDMDRLLEERLGCAIRLIFERAGEARFRELESELLGELLKSEVTRVVASGGGVIELAANRTLIARRAIAVYLRAEPQQLWLRLRRDATRPLLQVADPRARLERLHAERSPHYEALAAISIDAFAVPMGQLVDDVQRQLEGLGRPNIASGAAGASPPDRPPSADGHE